MPLPATTQRVTLHSAQRKTRRNPTHRSGLGSADSGTQARMSHAGQSGMTTARYTDRMEQAGRIRNPACSTFHSQRTASFNIDLMHNPFALKARYLDFKYAIGEVGCHVFSIQTFR